MNLVDEDQLEHTISGPSTASHGQMTEGEGTSTNKALQTNEKNSESVQFRLFSIVIVKWLV